MYQRSLARITLLTAALVLPIALVAQDADRETARSFESEIRPLVKKFCLECHSGDRLEAELDLAGFRSVADVRGKLSTWQRVDEMLQTEQMPPIDATQPTDAQREKLRMWLRSFLVAEARARAGDPGPVVLRRLSNAEYTYTIHDLTGVTTLDPAKEFPVDGAAGEGFTNTGSGLVMSPSLVQKYLAAGKQIAQHAALLPDGVRFAPYTSQRDLTDDAIKRIRDFYARYTVGGGGSSVNLQGVQFDTNQGGVLDVEAYLIATIAERQSLVAGQKTIQQVADQRKLSPKYLGLLWRELTSDDDESILLSPLRKAWREANSNDVQELRTRITAWQNQLWKFNVVGHLGREGAPQSWMEPQTPIIDRQEFRLKLPPSMDGQDIVVHLTVGDAGDGAKNDFALWRDMRLEAKGQTPIRLRDLGGIDELRTKWNSEILSRVEDYLAVIANAGNQPDVEALAATHKLNPSVLRTWMKYLQLSVGGPAEVKSHFTNKMAGGAGHTFINGWGTHETPSVAANSSDQQVRIPGISRPHSVVVHPSPTLFVAIGWQSPIDGVVQVQASAGDAHPECGNGIEWLVQHRFGNQINTLARGDFPIGKSVQMKPQSVAVRKGELVSLLVGPRDGNHSCDLTAVELTITESAGKKRVWNLGQDVSDDILASNPHADSHGNAGTWHFYKGPMAEVRKQTGALTIPAASLLAKWRDESDNRTRRELAKQIAALVDGDAPEGETANGFLYQQLHALKIPLDDPRLLNQTLPDSRFGIHPLGHSIDPDHIVVRAPSTLKFQLPALLAANRELVVTGMCDVEDGHEGSIQLQVSTSPPADHVLQTQPVICKNDSQTRERIEADFKKFRELFPIALCYAKIVPVDEVVTATLFHREDDLFQELMLSETETTELNRIWDELIFVSEAPLKQVVVLEQIRAFSTQDRQDLVGPWDNMKPSVLAAAAKFRQRQLAAEPIHFNAVIDFAQQAWRRPITDSERSELDKLYHRLRSTELAHDQAIRLLIARILTSPTFLYRQEQVAAGAEAQPVDNFELANRLSYFLWSSQPDDELRAVAATKQLTNEAQLISQSRRMLKDEKARRMAIHFACQWLHLRDFDTTVEKNEALYPNFNDLRGDMYHETVLFFDDLIRNDRSTLTMFDADHTFLNEALARHYGIDGVNGPNWRRVQGLRDKGRGGLLGMATVLASQSGASRTSPILRGTWVSETLLGERLPKPPANVPQLPESVPAGLSARELIERHSSVPACARCHERIDPYGFTLEQFDTVGRMRTERADTKSKLANGLSIDGIDGLKDYLLKTRRRDVVRQFSRKLLGYALAREIQLSDESLLEQIEQRLEQAGFRFSAAVETIVLSKQFRQIRGRDFVDESDVATRSAK